MSADEVLPKFGLLEVNDNPKGWGPYTLPERYRDMPYQPFSKDQRIGKVADWTGNIYQDKRYQNRYMSHLANSGGTQYTYYHEEDESSFVLVDTQKTQPRLNPRQRFQRINNAQRQRRERQRFSMAGATGLANQQLSKAQLRMKQQYQKKWLKQTRQNQEYQRRPQRAVNRESSVQVQESWKVLEELDFVRLSKLSVPLNIVTSGEDLYACGEMEYYDKTYDRVSTKSERKLQRVNRVIHTVTTTLDPVIRKLAKERKGNVFVTDSILATLMCCTRSHYSWDIVVQKLGDTLFFDKREGSDFDLLTVHETAADQTLDDSANGLNSAKNLALEATFINHNFSQQVLRNGDKKFSFDNKNPFVEDEEEEAEVASVGYRYRSWNLGGDKLNLVVRCEHDAVTQGPNEEVQFINIKALNEFDPRVPGAVDWRSKMDSQRGAVLAAELKNNAFKLAKWTVCSLLAGSDQLKLGYVSRVNPKDSSKHVILGTQQFKPNEFASQINLSMENCWGIFKCLVNTLMDRPNGKYLVLKDPNKQMIRLYDIPNNSFESDDEDEEGDDGQDEDDERDGDGSD
uniref:Eukaryotic translation initiation factor 3 subunit D n=1 Tax=Macrostomum lignano TaxID=282301 RepID=A0A1I8GFL3_9PLAT